MKKILKMGAIALTGLVLLTGCRTSTVYNVNNDPIDVKTSSDNVYNAIKRAGLSKGWIVTQIKPGLAQARLNLRKHVAVVEIPYSEKEFSIIYKNSQELNYDASTNQIHSNYNGWIQNLENAIMLEVSAYSK